MFLDFPRPKVKKIHVVFYYIVLFLFINKKTQDLAYISFNLFGVIVDIHILRFWGEFRDFGFICFKSEEDVEYLLRENPKIKVGGRKVFFARPLKQGSSGAKGKVPAKLPASAKGIVVEPSSAVDSGSNGFPK